MKTDNLIVVGLVGAAGLLVAKAMGINLSSLTGSKPQATTFAQSIWQPFKPLAGVPYNPANPAQYIPNSLLINGTIHDVLNNDASSYYTPTINDITSDVLSNYYGTSGGTSGNGQKSVIANPAFPSWLQ